MAGRIRHLHERNGRYEARLAVPVKLREIIGKTEFVEALGGDRREALKRLPEAVAKFRAQIRDAERSLETAMLPVAVSHVLPALLHEDLARRRYDLLLRLDQEGRTQNSRFAQVQLDDERVRWLREGSAGRLDNAELDECVGDVIAQFRVRGLTDVVPHTRAWRELAILLAAAELEAMKRFSERDEGDYSGQLTDTRLVEKTPASPAGSPPASASGLPTVAKLPPVSLKGLFDRWRLQRRRGSAEETVTDRRYRPVLRDFVAFLGHDDATRVTNSDVGNWIEHLLTVERKSQKTVRDVDLAVIKSLLRWGSDNGHIARVEITSKVAKTKVRKSRDRGFSDEEAAKLLSAASAYQPAPGSRESIFTTRARRWAPWLCSLTGARISELMQLRAEDVQERDGIPYLLITPEAGSVKTSEFREVPIHPGLVARGFHDLVQEQGSGPLFYAASTSRSGHTHPAKIASGRISEWIRSLGIVPEDIQPSHAWRHRFRTLARDLKLDSRVIDDILGHAPSSAGERYGSVTLKIKAETIAAMPAWPAGHQPAGVDPSKGGGHEDGNDPARAKQPQPEASET